MSLSNLLRDNNNILYAEDLNLRGAINADDANITNSINANSISLVKTEVTQITNLNTDVNVTGRKFVVTTVAASLGAGAFASFNVINPDITVNDIPLIQIGYLGSGDPEVTPIITAGNLSITVFNRHSATALNAVIKLYCLIV